MLRRLALLVALLAPAAGLAQLAGQALTAPAAFGTSDCTSTSPVTIAWKSSSAPVSGDFYRLYVGLTEDCTTTAVSTNPRLPGDVTALSDTGSYPVTGTLTRQSFLSTAGVTTAMCTPGGADRTIYVCVQLVPNTGSTVRTVMTGTVSLVLAAPAAPTGVTVAPGNSAIYVSWFAGTGSTVAAATYEVTATASDPANAADVHIQVFTGTTNNRISGLTNGVTYEVTVVALSEGSNRSNPSPPAYGTPVPTASFWDQYQADQQNKKDGKGFEAGGCAGGAAGLVSLLGVALALGRLRRRS